MPTVESTEPAGGRVTRSLRKRLTSIDSDVPSRPGTPVNANLQTIPETYTPKKRVTRRTSLSNTPSALTPAKESLSNTPGRRVTRRRSVNISESEDQTVQLISKEPTIAVVKEEEPEVESPKVKPKRVLRSSSKSPNDPESTKNKKQLSKKVINQKEQEEQDQDIIVLDDSIDGPVLEKPIVKKNARVSIKKENIIEIKQTPSPRKDKNRSSGAGIETPVKSASKRDSILKITPEDLKSDKNSGRKSKSAEKKKQPGDEKSSPLVFEQIEKSKKSPGPTVSRLSLSNKNQSSPAREKPTQNSPLKRNQPEPLKNVAFNEAADESIVKNVYPKTPGLIKSKSYILDTSNDVDKDETFKSKKDQSYEENEIKSDKGNSDEEEAALQTSKTPYKLKLMAVESSTPIQNSSPKKGKTSEMEQKEKSVKENRMITEEGVVPFPKSWTSAVSGIVCDTLKIDCIVSETSLQQKQAQKKSINKSLQGNTSGSKSQSKLRQNDSEVSEAEDDMLEKDDEKVAETEKDFDAEKTTFLDDEPMEEITDKVKSVKNIKNSSSKDDYCFEETETESDIVNSDDEVSGSIKKLSVKGSTSISNSSSKKLNKTPETREQKRKSAKDNLKTSFRKSWTNSVSGTVGETSKIDCIISEKSLKEEKQAQKKTNKSIQSNASPSKRKSKLPQHDSDSEAEDDMLEEDDEKVAETEKDFDAEKTTFLDDDPMEKIPDKVESVKNIKISKDHCFDETETESEIENSDEKVSSGIKRMAVKGSTSIQKSSSKKLSKTPETKKKQRKSAKEDLKTSFRKSLISSVPGTVGETSKIDCVVSEKSLREEKQPQEKKFNKSLRDKSSLSKSQSKLRQNDSDASEAEDDMLEEDDEKVAETEKDFDAEKTTFLDDEPIKKNPDKVGSAKNIKTSNSKEDHCFEETESDFENSDDDVSARITKKSVKSNTTIQNSSSNKLNKTPETKEQKRKTAKENLKTSLRKSWTSSVSAGTVGETSKIDSIVFEKSLKKEKQAQKKTIDISLQGNASYSKNKSKLRQHDSDVSEAEDDMLEEDDEKVAEREKDFDAEKTTFLDDEPMEEIPDKVESLKNIKNFKSKKDHCFEETESDSENSDEEVSAGIQRMTVKDSTAIENSSSKKINETPETKEQNRKSAEENLKTSLRKSCNSSVSGTVAEISKIDCIVSEKSLKAEKLVQEKTTNKEIQNTSHSKSKLREHDSDFSEAEDDMLEEDDEKVVELEKEGDAEKTKFLDGAQMEEIPEKAESVKNIKNSNSKEDHCFEETETESDIENLDEKVSAVKGSPSIQNSSSKTINKIPETKEQNRKSNMEDMRTSFPKSWTSSVSGTVGETLKIDCIVSEKSLREEKQAQEAANKSQSNVSKNRSTNKSHQHDSDTSDDEDDMLEEDDEFGEEEEDEQNAEKSLFIDDEAMEVPEGEESMDSEERAYLEEHEVPAYGESIGSQDSEEDDGDGDEPDEDDAAFVVSDAEVIEELLSSEDEVEKLSKQKKFGTSKEKIYKRICRTADSSDDEEQKPTATNKEDTEEKIYKRISRTVDSSDDEEEKPTATNKEDTEEKTYKRICRTEDSSDDEEQKPTATNKDDTDFCLLVDSSFEDEKSQNAKQNNMPLKNIASDVKNKSVRDKSLKEISKLDNSKIGKTDPEDVADKENQAKDIQDESPSEIINENNISKDLGRKSEESKPNSSQLNKTIQDSDIEMEEEEYSNTTQSKPETSQIDDVSPTVLKSAEKKRLTKSPTTKRGQDEIQKNEQEPTVLKSAEKKRLTKSPTTKRGQDEIQKNEQEPTALKSVEINKSSTTETSADDSQKNEQESTALKSPQKKRLTKSPKRKSTATIDQDESEDEKECNTSKNSVKSVNKSMICEDDGFETINKKSPKKSRKSTTKTIDESANKETLDVSQRKSLDNSNSNKNVSLNEEKESSKNRKSLNESRKSLIRTSTEETNDDNADQSTVEKTKLSLDEGSEPEETLSASENPLDTSAAGKTLNTSKKFKKILVQNSSLQEEQSKEPEKPQRRKSIAHKSIIHKSSESSADSEDENEEKVPTDSLQIDQSKRRKSIAQLSITKGPSERSDDSEEDNTNKSSPEMTDDEMESSHDDAAEAQFSEFSDEENVATNRTISEFLGEGKNNSSSSKNNSSRRKSIVVANESKLDETFQLDPKSSLSSSLRQDSLHRSILRKSLNHSQKRTEPTEAYEDDIDEEDNNSDEEDDSSEEEEVQIKKKIVSEKGLSVSLNSIQIKKKQLKDAKAIRNSFTIGVSVRKNSSEGEDSSDAEPVADNKKLSLANIASSENEDVPSDDHSSSSSSESKLLSSSEKKVLENVKDVHHVGPYKSRKSMSNAILAAPPSEGVDQKKRIKRTSLYLKDENASNSFVENLVEEKNKINKKKRKSNSFCGVVAPLVEEDSDDVRPKEPRSEKKPKKTFEPEIREENVDHILNRCEQMIDAANEAKRIAKLEAKKLKVKKPKKMDKEEKSTKSEEPEVEIPLVSKKEIKRKEKMKKELAKALKQSATVLSKVIEPEKKAKKNATSKIENNNINPAKRLEAEFLESLVELSNPNKKKSKEVIETTPPSDKENSKKKSKKMKYRIEDIHKKIESDIETLETACGTVIVEPSTPQKLRFQHGFRESPKTPIGFKIQDINDKKTDKKCARKLKTTSGSFIEEDLAKSKKTDLNKQKPRKRKLPCIEEPTYTLPKTQWTTSGVFVEEDLSYARPLANSTATQFLVASLNGGKKNKSSTEVISSTSLNTAQSFKSLALQKNKGVREKSTQILHNKQRKMVNHKF